MKTRSYFSMGVFALTLLASFTACQQDEIMEQPTVGNNTYTAVIEQPVDSRTTVNHTSGAFSWINGEEINVFANDNNHTTSTINVTNGVGTFTATDNVLAAVYPSNVTATFDNRGVPTTVTLPASYIYDATIGTSVNTPMVAILTPGSEHSTAKFKHLGGVMAFTFTNVPANVSQFTFTSFDKKITGEFTVKGDTDKYIETDESTGNDKTVTVQFTTAPTEGNDLTVYVPLPVGEYQNFTVQLLDASSKALYTHIANSNKANKIERCTLGLMPSTIGRDYIYTANGEQLPDGSTASANTYTVYTAKGLQAVNELINKTDNNDSVHDLDTNITLGADINMKNAEMLYDNGKSNWVAIGNDKNPYTGVFEGNDKKITGLTICYEGENKYHGLFGYIKGSASKVQNVTLVDANIQCNLNKDNLTARKFNYVGGIVGIAKNGPTVSKCVLTGNSDIKGNEYVGGIVGGTSNDSNSEKTNIYNCHTYTDTNASTIVIEGVYVGGIAGYMYTNSTIEQCSVKGAGESLNINGVIINDVTKRVKIVGGIVGFIVLGPSEIPVSVVDCSVESCNINCPEMLNEQIGMGGIVGLNAKCVISGCTVKDCNISNSYETPTDSKYTKFKRHGSGGIVGINVGTVIACRAEKVNITTKEDVESVGGIVGNNYPTDGNLYQYTEIRASYAFQCSVSTSKVAFKDNDANIVGINTNSAATDRQTGYVYQCYYTPCSPGTFGGLDTEESTVETELGSTTTTGAIHAMNGEIDKWNQTHNNIARKWDNDANLTPVINYPTKE